MTPFGHSGSAFGSGVLQDHDRILIDVQRRIVDPTMQIFEVLEHDRRTFVLQQTLACCSLLEDGPIRAKVASQYDQASVAPQRTVSTSDHITVHDLGTRNVFSNSFPGDS